MPSNWLSFDSNFPSFTGEESPTQQIRMLHNYLFQLREGLQYSLQNLTADNFNAAALQNMTDSQKNELSSQLKKVYGLLNQLSGEIDSLSGRVSGTENLAGRLTAAEEEITYLQNRADGHDEKIAGLEDDIAAQAESLEDLESRTADLEGSLLELEKVADEVSQLQETVDGEGGLRERTGALEESLTGEGGLQEQMNGVLQEQEKISEAVRVAEDGSTSVGSAGKVLNLVGQIYINGVLYEQGGIT